MEKQSLLRQLPAVDQVLHHPLLEDLSRKDHTLVVDSVRQVLERWRQDIIAGRVSSPPDLEDLVLEIRDVFTSAERNSLRPVINATGIVLHTNLGRAVLSRSAAEAVLTTASNYTNLEFNLVLGQRGNRYEHVAGLLTELTGGEAALVVNNNAAAVLLVLTALASGRETVISRGQLVEIGGSFRIPEVMAQSGTKLVEVGTTNKTYIRDYEAALTAETALLLKVHPSNYRIRGFTHEVTTAELVELGKRWNIPVLEDLGSGLLMNMELFGIIGEPTVQQEIKQGVDIVTFSGDKLLGGPQAGIIIGRKELLDVISHHPLTRAVRVDKMTLAALEATLKLYRDPSKAVREIPTLAALAVKLEQLKEKAQKLKGLLSQSLINQKAKLGLKEIASQAGGGSLPLIELPSWGVVVKPERLEASKLAEKLRQSEPPVLVRIQENALILDVRTLLPGDEEKLAGVLARAMEV